MMDPKLVQQAMNGNAKATEQLFTETYAKTYALAFRLLRNAQDAEDLVQEAYISAFLNLERIQDPSKFDVWMKQIVSNRCKDFFKKKQPTLFTDLEAPEDEGPLEFEDTAVTFSPEAVADREETARIVQTLMEQLPEEQRICLLMVDGAEMTSADAAGALGIPEGTVKSRVRYGRKKMEELVSDYEKKNNIRLHGLGPIAILGLLRWMQSSVAAQPTAEAVSAVVQGATHTAAALSSAGSTAAVVTTAGKTVTTTFFQIIKKGLFIMKLDKIRTTAIAIAAVVLAFLASLPFWVSGPDESDRKETGSQTIISQSDNQDDNLQTDNNSQVKQVDLSRIVSMKFDGYNGCATPVAGTLRGDETNASSAALVGSAYFESLISKTRLDQYRSVCSKEKKEALGVVYDDNTILFDYTFKLEFEKAYNNLSNGDTVKARLVLQDPEKQAGITIEELEEHLNLDFGSREYTVVVSGLEEAPENAIDIFDGVLDYFEFTGTNNAGLSKLELPEDYTHAIGDLYFKYDDHDTVKVIYQNKKIGTISYSVYDSEYMGACPVVSGKVAKISGSFHPQKDANGSAGITLADLGYTIITNHRQIMVPEMGEYLTDKSQLTDASYAGIKLNILKDFYNGRYVDDVCKYYVTTLKPGIEMQGYSKSPMSISAIIHYTRSKYETGYCIARVDDIILKEDGTFVSSADTMIDSGRLFSTVEEAEAYYLKERWAENYIHEPLG